MRVGCAKRSQPFGRFIVVLLATAAGAAAGCSGDDSNGSPGVDAGASEPLDATTGSDAPSAPDTSVVLDASVPEVDAALDVHEAGVDAAPPVDCTLEPPDAGDAGEYQLPKDLYCTGLYAIWSNKTIAPDARAFAPGYRLWSDGAVKSRWIHLPPGTTIDATDPNEWRFPIGTKLWKEFVVGGKKKETRLFMKVGEVTWARTSYQWSDDESSATRIDTGAGGPPADAGLIDDGGGLDGAINYEIPSVQKCDQCHNGRIDRALGFEAVNLGAAAATGLTLAVLKSEGLLVTKDGGASPLPATLTIPDDGTSKGADAIGWLHTNCGTVCHNANPSAGCTFNSMRLRVEVQELVLADGGAPALASLQAYKTTHAVAAQTDLGDPAKQPYQRLAPGDPSKSLIRYLTGRRTTTEPYGQMPPLDTHTVDVADVANLNAWILAMP